MKISLYTGCLTPCTIAAMALQIVQPVDLVELQGGLHLLFVWFLVIKPKTIREILSTILSLKSIKATLIPFQIPVIIIIHIREQQLRTLSSSHQDGQLQRILFGHRIIIETACQSSWVWYLESKNNLETMITNVFETHNNISSFRNKIIKVWGQRGGFLSWRGNSSFHDDSPWSRC